LRTTDHTKASTREGVTENIQKLTFSAYLTCTKLIIVRESQILNRLILDPVYLRHIRKKTTNEL